MCHGFAIADIGHVFRCTVVLIKKYEHRKFRVIFKLELTGQKHFYSGVKQTLILGRVSTRGVWTSPKPKNKKKFDI